MKPRLDTVLAYVNRARKAMGYRSLKHLPKGRRGDDLSCPLAKALRMRVSGIGVYPTDRKRAALEAAWRALKPTGFVANRDVQFELPSVLYRFVSGFDWGDYPSLEQK